MTFNLTVNESTPTIPPVTPGHYNVRAFYNQADAGHVSGPFSSLESAEKAATSLLSRSEVLNVVIETIV